MITDIKALVDQIPPSVGSEGVMGYPAMSKLGQLFTADWKLRLLMAGKLWRFSNGTLSGDDAVGYITGGGAGTVVDLDEPEIAISVPAGYFLIPIEVLVAGVVDFDADLEVSAILVTLDRTQEPAGVTSATTPTMYNLLDGGGAFPGTAYGEVTVVTTNPTNEELLAAKTYNAHLTTDGMAVTDMNLHYEPQVPSIVAGPCTLCVYWGASAAMTALGMVVVGCVPTSWFPTS